MIIAENLTKTYGPKTAVDGISLTVAPGKVTGFLGPNGAGKSTTMRMVVGLDRPTSGSVTVNGRRYAQHRSPLPERTAFLEPVEPGAHSGCSRPWLLTRSGLLKPSGRRRPFRGSRRPAGRGEQQLPPSAGTSARARGHAASLDELGERGEIGAVLFRDERAQVLRDEGRQRHRP